MRPDDLIGCKNIDGGFSPDICNLLEYVRSYSIIDSLLSEKTRDSRSASTFSFLEYGQLLTIFVYLCTTTKYLEQ